MEPPFAGGAGCGRQPVAAYANKESISAIMAHREICSHRPNFRNMTAPIGSVTNELRDSTTPAAGRGAQSSPPSKRPLCARVRAAPAVGAMPWPGPQSFTSAQPGQSILWGGAMGWASAGNQGPGDGGSV
jgi:hypothetical protein